VATRKSELEDEVRRWKEWAKRADRSENGWETDDAGWAKLADLVRAVMADSSASNRELELAAFCWSLAEESEEFSRFAGDHNKECLRLLQYITSHGDERARWQVYAAIGTLTAETKKILEQGLSDPDFYCRRMALLTWARLRLPAQKSMIERHLRHSDPYLRQVTLDLAKSARDPALMEKVKSALLHDPVDFVRKAAQES
jgi:HEAT repeat protein